MNIRKLISIFAAVTMLSTSLVSASAAVATEDQDGYILLSVDTLENEAGIKARQPKYEFTAKRLTTAGELKALSGVSTIENVNGKAYQPGGANEVYFLELKITDIGDLYNGYDSDQWNDAYVKLDSFEFDIKSPAPQQNSGADLIKSISDTVPGAGDKVSFGYNVYGELVCSFATLSGVSVPSFDSAADPFVSALVSNNDLTLDFKWAVALPKGSVIDTATSNISTKIAFDTNFADKIQLTMSPAVTAPADEAINDNKEGGQEFTQPIVAETTGSYGFAKINSVTYDKTNYDYIVKATATNNETKEWNLFTQYKNDFEGETTIENLIAAGESLDNVPFYVVVKSNLHTISKVEILKRAK